MSPPRYIVVPNMDINSYYHNIYKIISIFLSFFNNSFKSQNKSSIFNTWLRYKKKCLIIEVNFLFKKNQTQIGRVRNRIW